MKKVLRIICVVLCFIMAVSALTGCGNKANPTTAATTTSEGTTQAQTTAKPEPLKITLCSMVTGSMPAPDNFMKKWYLENKNIDIADFQAIPADLAQISTKCNMWIASGEVPDYINFLVWPDGVALINKMADAKLIAPMDEWIEKYPSFGRYFLKSYIDNYFRNKNDGKLYCIPNCCPVTTEPRDFQDVGPMIREDWLATVGMTAPKTKDELFNVLSAFKEKIPDVNNKKIIPLSGDGWYAMLMWSFGVKDMLDDNGSFVFTQMNPGYEEFGLYMNKLYRAGLLDKELFIHQAEQYTAKLTEGRVGYVPCCAPPNQMDTINATLNADNSGKKFVGAPYIENSPGVKPVRQLAGGNQYLCGVISAKFASNADNMARFMELLDWAYTAEGNFVTMYGPPGQFFEKGDDGYYSVKAEYKAEYEASAADFQIKYGLFYYMWANNVQTQFPKAERMELSPAAMDKDLHDAQYGIWLNTCDQENSFLTFVTLAGSGPLETDKLQNLAGSASTMFSNAVMADTEADCRKHLQEMKDYLIKGGIEDIAAERGKRISDYMAGSK